MKALTLHAPGDLRCEDVARPELTGMLEVIVKVELTAVCGSDLHIYHGREKGLDAGTIMGHEFLGTVVEAGAAVARFKEGARVVAPFTTSCGACFYCKQGLTCRCERGQLFGWVEGGKGLHGAQAEYVRVPLADPCLVEVPEGVADDEALLAGDVLSTGFFCAELGMVAAGSSVVVIGCGPVGLMGIVGARELGAAQVFAIDSVAERLALAERMGATPIDRSACDPLELVHAATEGRGADVVLELVGSPRATRAAVDLVRPGGTIAACGVHTEKQFAFSPVEAYDKNLTYRAGRCPARHYAERMLDLLATGKYPVGEILTHRMPLEEGAAAYEMFAARRGGCVKAILTP